VTLIIFAFDVIGGMGVIDFVAVCINHIRY